MNTTSQLLATKMHPTSNAQIKPSGFESIMPNLQNKTAQLGVVGLGYVGLPIALEFAKKYKVIGYDINSSKVAMMAQGQDPSKELKASDFRNTDIQFTISENKLDDAQVYIVAVPTPVDADCQPDLRPLQSACAAIGKTIKKGNIIVFESTVYPGCTEEICVPILESLSGLKMGEDFKVGYSPERINPGDTKNTLTSITKIVSGSDEQAARIIEKIYGSIITAGIHVAPNIKVAEAAKVVENTQRDVNIALMNELSNCFNGMGIDTQSVLSAAGTKWNFLNFYPGLVGGHCIGVDPYYLIHKAQSQHISLPIIKASRETNDHMPHRVLLRLLSALRKQDKKAIDAKVLVLGATFKENVADVRNSKAAELIQLLKINFDKVDITDPMADVQSLQQHYEIQLVQQLGDNYDVIIHAVNHDQFKEIDWSVINEISSKECVVMDFKDELGHPTDAPRIDYLTL